LRHAGGGFGMVALTSLLGREGLLAAPASGLANPFAAKPPHFAAKAQRVIFLFMSGGPSHVDLLDPKPELIRLAGQPIPESFGTFKTRRAVAKNKLLAPLREFRPRGQSGTEISDFLPHIASCADELCVLRGCHGDSVTHPESVYQMNTGSILMGRPSLGSWATYGLGTENQNMPAFVVMPDPSGWVKGGAPAWGNGYMPAAYQGTILRGGASPILNLTTPAGISGAQQAATVDFINQLNRENLAGGEEDSELAARIAAYELAFRMQQHAPDVVDISRETEATKKLYGLPENHRGVRPALFAGAPDARARCALCAALLWRHQRLGRPCRHGGQPLQTVCAERSARRRPVERFEITRSPRFDAGDLGRRVRSHADERRRERSRS